MQQLRTQSYQIILLDLLDNFVHISALGIDDVEDSNYAKSKLEGEKNIFEGLISEECYTNDKISDILIIQKLKDCEELKKIKN
mgnify:CR=1 FL=1